MLGEPGRVQPTLFLWIMAAVVVVLGVWLGRYLPDIWRGGRAYGRVKRLFDYFGEPFSTSMVSSLPIDSPFLVAFGILAVVIFVRDLSSGALRAAMETAGNVLVPLFLLLLLLLFSVLLFARPKVLIPPHLRPHHGIVGELLVSSVRWISSLPARRRTDGRKR